MARFKIIFRESFYFLTLALVIGIILEFFFPNIILAHFNLNWLLSGALICGLLSLLGGKG
jgi:hypothetical protein